MINDNAKNLSKLDLLVKTIEKSLVNSVEASSFPSNTKIPFRTFMLRESLLHRTADLGSNAYNLFYEEKALTGLIITRSMLETVAILYLLKYKIERTLDSKDLNSFSEYLARLTTGSKNNSSDLEAINVLSAIDIWAKEKNNIRNIYDNLSEFAHPNYWGNVAIMGKIDKVNYKLNFGKEFKKWESPLKIGILAAIFVTESSFDIYNKMAEILPRFIDLCKLEN